MQALRGAVLAVDRVTTTVVTWAACAALALAACMAIGQVFMRYVVRQPTAWSEPVVQMAVIWMVYLGAAATFRAGALVAIDLLVDRLRGRWQRGLRVVIAACALVLLLHMGWYGWEMVERARFNVNPTLGISMSWGFAAIPVGAAFAIIAVIAHALDPPPREIDTGT
ncbi:TRAP transporter small permease [Falsiroseomonas oryzae]|uniref:TRAP transporter small permease n=1 Tax=Falsiroseomonas oryzae TaxID=2766473 RepID=UPI0022EAFB63|nr:TRAP transporter small permease [Roseomonas sp. MO-31]